MLLLGYLLNSENVIKDVLGHLYKERADTHKLLKPP